MSDTIGFIGLGLLGLPMATNLLNAGYSLRVYNRTASKTDPLVAKGAYLASSPADTAISGGVVASIVWDDAALESIVTSDGFLEKLGQGGVHVAMGTVLPETSKKMAALHAQHGSVYVDAPIFGRPEAPMAKQLWIPISGPQQAKDRVKPLLEAMGGQGIFDFGEEVGAANLVKLIGNYLSISAGHSMHEAVKVARKMNVDPKAVMDMLTTTLLDAPIYKSYGKRVVEMEKPFSLSAIPLKDVGLLEKLGQEVDSPTPIAHVLLEILKTETP
jgi:3-hydroxyisobutyrate dehydrogenase-like beta-hydroxyacid dehydrogenase